jgi:hypothetical protein
VTEGFGERADDSVGRTDGELEQQPGERADHTTGEWSEQVKERSGGALGEEGAETSEHDMSDDASGVDIDRGSD